MTATSPHGLKHLRSGCLYAHWVQEEADQVCSVHTDRRAWKIPAAIHRDISRSCSTLYGRRSFHSGNAGLWAACYFPELRWWAWLPPAGPRTTGKCTSACWRAKREVKPAFRSALTTLLTILNTIPGQKGISDSNMKDLWTGHSALDKCA